MRIFWLVLLVTAILNYVARQHPSVVYNTETRLKEYKPNKFLVFLIIFIMVMVSGLRRGIGDTYTYKQIIDTIPASVPEFLSSNVISEDKGFYLIVAFVKQFISTNNQVSIFVFALITLSLLIYFLYKYTDNMLMATFLFITMGCYGVSMNGVRQYVATAILFTTLPLIKKGKFIPYTIIVLLTSTIHASAIIFLPIYFLRYFKGWGFVTYCLLIGGAFLYVTYGVTGPMIANLIGESQYGHYSEALLSNGEGANFIRSLVALVPIALSYLRKDMVNKKLKYGNLIINLSVLNFIFTLLANKYWIYARFCIYFNVYTILLLCFCMDNIFEKSSSKIIKMLCVGCYLFYFWYDSTTSGLRYTSDFIKL